MERRAAPAVVLAYVAIVCGLASPLVAGNLVVGAPTPFERAVAMAVGLLCAVASLAAMAWVRELPMDLSAMTRVAWRVAPYPAPPLRDAPGALKHVGTLAVWAAFFLFYGATRLDFVDDAPSAADAAQSRLTTALACLVAVGVLGFAAAWPVRLRRAVPARAGRP